METLEMAVKYVDGLEAVSLAFLQPARKGYQNLEVPNGLPAIASA